MIRGFARRSYSDQLNPLNRTLNRWVFFRDPRIVEACTTPGVASVWRLIPTTKKGSPNRACFLVHLVSINNSMIKHGPSRDLLEAFLEPRHV